MRKCRRFMNVASATVTVVLKPIVIRCSAVVLLLRSLLPEADNTMVDTVVGPKRATVPLSFYASFAGEERTPSSLLSDDDEPQKRWAHPSRNPVCRR